MWLIGLILLIVGIILLLTRQDRTVALVLIAAGVLLMLFVSGGIAVRGNSQGKAAVAAGAVATAHDLTAPAIT